MIRTLLVLPDGRQLFSGTEGAAVASATLTRTVNPQQELTLGAVCPAMLECKLLDAADVSVAPGDALTLYHVDETETLHRQGIFLVQELTRSGAGMVDMVAYDPLILLDRDMTEFVNTLTDWPYTLQQLGQMVCQACGLTLAYGELLNGDHPVQKFSVQGITGRQLMQWIAEATGSFCTADAQGEVTFGYYTPLQGHLAVTKAVEQIEGPDHLLLTGDLGESWELDALTLTSELLDVSDDGSGNVVLTIAGGAVTHLCCQGGAQISDYTTMPICKVQLRQSPEDVGTVYPDTPEENAYVITGNPLLTAEDALAVQPVAQNLFDRLQSVSYTPCKLKLQPAADIRPGQILGVAYRGKILSCYVMTTVQSATYVEVECTGAAQRGGTTATNNQSYQNLAGKVLNLRMDVDGLQVQNMAADGRMAEAELTLDKLSTRVSQQEQTGKGMEEKLMELTQTAEDVSIAVRSVMEDGVSKVVTQSGYTFSDDGLTISRSGQQMENRLDHKGMYVTRSGETMLRADAQGVFASDVSVRNYLVLGDYARIEDYATGTDKKRTACFWIGGE